MNFNNPALFYPSKVIQYCPFCGSKEFKCITEKHFTCCSCKKPFFINVAAAVAAIIKNQKGEILLTRRKHEPMKGTFDLPGGFIEPGESAEQGLKREILEELNIEIENLKYFGSFPNEYTYKELTYFTLDFIFICQAKSFENLEAKDDVEAISFFDLNKIDIETIGLSSIKKVITCYLESSITNCFTNKF